MIPCENNQQWDVRNETCMDPEYAVICSPPDGYTYLESPFGKYVLLVLQKILRRISLDGH